VIIENTVFFKKLDFFNKKIMIELSTKPPPTADQKVALISRHKKCRDKRECGRIKAVLSFAKDESVAFITDVLLLLETSVSRHINVSTPSGNLLLQAVAQVGIWIPNKRSA
jgi:hypothetical protein